MRPRLPALRCGCDITGHDDIVTYNTTPYYKANVAPSVTAQLGLPMTLQSIRVYGETPPISPTGDGFTDTLGRSKRACMREEDIAPLGIGESPERIGQPARVRVRRTVYTVKNAKILGVPCCSDLARIV